MPLVVDTAIPAGNGVVESIDGDEIHLRPDLRTTTEPWFWWHIRVRGCAGRRLRVVMTRAHTLTSRGAVVSRDQGRSWQWIEGYDLQQWSFCVDAGPTDELRLALSLPYTRQDLDQWLVRWQGHPALRVETLGLSANGAAVPLLRLGNFTGGEQAQALITCRHHACEAVASYALEGLMDTFLARDAQDMQRRWSCWVVPQVDYDGVQAGDQGKLRAPHDHNADYAGEPSVHPEIRAIKHLQQHCMDQRQRLALDLHCPWVRDRWNEHIYIVGSSDPHRARQQQTLADALAAIHQGSLPFGEQAIIPFGESWNITAGLPARNFGRYSARQAPAAATVATFEIPYATVRGAAISAAAAREFGASLAQAMADLAPR